MRMLRVVCALLLCAFLIPLFPVSSHAVESVSVDVDRFMSHTIFAGNATLSRNEDGSVLMAFRNTTPVLYAAVLPLSDADSGNAIRIVLENNSPCNILKVSYWQGSELFERQISIERRSSKQDYFLYIDRANDITDINLSLYGGSSGTVRLYGIGIVSVYDDSADNPGEITECTYQPKTKTVTVGGNIRHEIVSGIRGATVALYAFGMNDTVTDAQLRRATPIATTPFSVRFEFSVPATSFAERFVQYVVAIVSAEGEILYRYTPSVPCTPSSEAVAPAFKGVNTAHGSLAASADAGLAIVDVYLDRMQSEKNNGLLHQADGTYFYVDRGYIYQLDEEIEQYSNDGCQVYLRFLLSGGSEYNVLHGSTPSSADPVHNGISLSGELSRATLYAYTEFLCQRYVSQDKGKIHGVILGHSVDLASAYNYVGNKTLAEYTELYGAALHVISEAAKQSGYIDLVVPLSDRYDPDGSVAGRVGTYPARLLAVSLCKMIEDRFGGAFSIRLLFDTAQTPGLMNAVAPSQGRVSVDNLAEWETSLGLLSRRYGSICENYLYCWTPSGALSEKMLSAAYVYSYYKLATGKAASFVLQPDGIEDTAVLRSLFETVKYVNTQEGKNKNREILFDLGAISWSELIPGINEKSLVTRNIYVYKTYSIPASSIRGSYVMWDHQQGRSVYDWFASSDCSSLHVEDVEGMGRALVTTVTGEEVCSEIVYNYSADEVMGAVDMLSVDLMILGETGRSYEIAFELCGEKSVCLVNATVESGKRTTIYISTLQLDKSDSVRNIRLITAAEMQGEPYQICIGHLSAHSNHLTDAELEEAILEARLSSMEQIDEIEEPKSVEWQLIAGLTVLILLVSAAIVFTLAKRNDD